MICITIQKEEAGRKLARFLEKRFPKAPRSLFFKGLRNRKIKVNGKKPEDLHVVLQAGDEVRLFYTDEELRSFGYDNREKKQSMRPVFPAAPVSVPIIYEDENLLILDKPAGMLSQKSRLEDVSLTEIGRQMVESRQGRALQGYRPGVCNRLDRNTAGAVIMAKTLSASQAVAEMLRGHTLGKFYWALVEGRPEKWRQETTLVHEWSKDEALNKVRLREASSAAGQKVESRVRLLRCYDGYSLVEVQLLTGKSHQIRAQLAQEGHPILGDGKYNPSARGFAPMLVAKRLEFRGCPETLAYMEGKTLEASLPKTMQERIK